jgi:hypothetical protein
VGGKTRTVTVNSIAATAISAFGYPKSIVVNEDQSVAGWPTVDYMVMKPTAGDQPKRVMAGQAYNFGKDAGSFVPGEVAGYIQTVSGSSTFAIDEGGPN